MAAEAQSLSQKWATFAMVGRVPTTSFSQGIVSVFLFFNPHQLPSKVIKVTNMKSPIMSPIIAKHAGMPLVKFDNP